MDRRTGIAALALAIVALTVMPALASPVREQAGTVTMLHGGIGIDDRDAMERTALDYNLRLTLAQSGSGEYLAEVRVVISDAKGAKLIETMSSGPWFFVRLGEGDYRIAAMAGEKTLAHKVSIKGAARRDWVFRFE